jgi:hypothetical protein
MIFVGDGIDRAPRHQAELGLNFRCRGIPTCNEGLSRTKYALVCLYHPIVGRRQTHPDFFPRQRNSYEQIAFYLEP